MDFEQVPSKSLGNYHLQVGFFEAKGPPPLIFVGTDALRAHAESFGDGALRIGSLFAPAFTVYTLNVNPATCKSKTHPRPCTHRVYLLLAPQADAPLIVADVRPTMSARLAADV